MPEIKNTFLGGKMNKDLDERLLPKNEYRDALNVEVSTSQGDDIGALQNTWGNTAQSNISDVITGAKCIGSIEDKENEKIYWFIKGDQTHAIAEYDVKLRKTSPVLVDFGMTATSTLDFSATDINPSSEETNQQDENIADWINGVPVATNLEGSAWQISGGTATALHGRSGHLKLFIDNINLIEGYEYEMQYEVSYIDPLVDIDLAKVELTKHGKDNTNITVDVSSTGTKTLRWVQGSDASRQNTLWLFHNATTFGRSPFKIDNVLVRQVNRFLKFDNVDHITGINVLDGMLFWTDGVNEPKKINIRRSKAGSNSIVNFNATSYVGPELISSGLDTSNTTYWNYNLAHWNAYDSNIITVGYVPQYSPVTQSNVNIVRGKTYVVTMSISGTFTSGKIGPTLIDEFGGWTKVQPALFATSIGTQTWTITVGETSDTTLSNKDAGYTANQFFVQNEDSNTLSLGVIIDNISVKEIAVDFNTTTKVKDATGAYTRNVREEDITLIRKYPLNAPNIEFSNTTKATGSVIKTSCVTPYNTTYVNSKWMNDGFGDDAIQYKNFLHLFLSQDTINSQNLPNNTFGGTTAAGHRLLQFNVNNSEWWEALGNTNTGTAINQPIFIEENDHEAILHNLGSPATVNNSFTSKDNYFERAWMTWMSVGEYFNFHSWTVPTIGSYKTIGSSASIIIDKIGGRIWMTSGRGKNWTHDENDGAQKNHRFVLGHWARFNNSDKKGTFWTYVDGELERHVKPAGVKSNGAFTQSDGTQLWNSGGGGTTNNSDAIVLDPTEKYQNNPNDFGPGWSVVDGKYIGSAHTTVHPTGGTGVVTPHASHVTGLDYTGSATGDGWQYLHNVITNVKDGSGDYFIRMKVEIIDPGPISLTDAADGPFGISGLNVITGNSLGIDHPDRGKIGKWSQYSGAGTYYWEMLLENANENGAFTFFKRNGAEVIISEIQVEDRTSWKVQIQPLIFEPKPDYEEGDLIKMTNTTKAPNGDDINVVVKLGPEYTLARSKVGKSWRYKPTGGNAEYMEFVNADNNATYAPKSYHNDIFVGPTSMIADPDVRLTTSSYKTYVQGLGLTINPTFTSGPVLNSDGTDTADWNTNLEIVLNNDFSEADPDDSNVARYWNVPKPVTTATSGTPHTDTNAWRWHDGHVQGTLGMEVHNTNSYPGFRQLTFDSPKLYFERGGSYKYSFTTSHIDVSSGTAAIFFRMKLDNHYKQIATVSTNATHTGTVSIPSAPDQNSAAWTQYPEMMLLFEVATGTGNLNTGRISNISLKSNADINRIDWGQSQGGGAVVVTGNNMQLMGYPANPNGAKATNATPTAGDFTLTEHEYYKMTYEIVASNYVSGDSANANNDNCWIKLWDHDFWGRRFASSSSSVTNNGHILLDATVGTHEVIWKQSHTKTQLEICFGKGFEGQINNINVYPVTVTKHDYGTSTSNDARKIFDATIVSIDESLLQIPLEEHKYWECELIDQEPIFKDVFPRFAYRWKYKDGEYSAISAFTKAAFLPNEDYEYDANDGYNLSMENTVRRIKLTDFDIKPDSVVELDILYKESNSTSIYTLTTIKGAQLNDFKEYIITKEKYHALVESKQLLRPYDNVPRKAVSQEISANRIIFANYTQQYDISPVDEPIITASLVTSILQPGEEVAESIKSMRKYQVGMSYLDEFGRQSPVFSNDTALISIDQKNANTANDIQASLNNFPPDWVTHYKYFVKDVAEPFYNISLDRFWQAERSDHVWLSFPSSDYNKVKEDDYIILKKSHDSHKGVNEDVTVKYKVLARKSEAPEFIKVTRKSVGGKIFDIDGTGLEFFTQPSYGGTSAGYPQVGKTTFRIKGNVVENNAAFKEAVIDDQTGRYIRIGQDISGKPSYFSNYYEILHISRTDFGTNEVEDNWKGEEDFYEFTLVQPLGNDASFVGNAFDANKKIFIEYYREELNEFDNVFEGKFFIKIARNNFFDKYIAQKQKAEDVGYNILNAQDAHWARAWEDDAINTNADKGKDTDFWLEDRDNFNWFRLGNASYSTGNTDGQYNGTGVPKFPALMCNTVSIGGVSRTNPYIDTWDGTVRKADWNEPVSGQTDLTQRFCIDQAYSFGWDASWDTYINMSNADVYSYVGSGFVIGRTYCSFSFNGVGDVDLGTGAAIGGGGTSANAPDPASSAIDTNTWWDGSNKELSSQWFNNYELLNQLKKVGTQFRWQDDPSQTVYTITKVMRSAPVQRYHWALTNGHQYGEENASVGDFESESNSVLDKDKGNYGYRIDLMLDKPIVWSPTATIAAGTGWNTNSTHTTLTPFKQGTAGTTSQIQILEKRPSEQSYTSFNPAVFEVVPKERADLNLYYETPKTNMVIQEGMYIEALNNKSVNDYLAGGNYSTDEDVNTVYAPYGSPAIPYATMPASEMILNSDFTETDWNSYWLESNVTASGGSISADATLGTITVNTSTTGSIQFPYIRTANMIPIGDLVDGAFYRICVNVEAIDNDVLSVGGAVPSTKIIVKGHDGSSFVNYYPLPGSFPALHLGENVWEFQYNATAASSYSVTQFGILIELTDNATGAYTKSITLSKVSLKSYELDYSKPIIQIHHGEKYAWCDNPNKIQIDSNWDLSNDETYGQGQDLPDGITIRLSKRDTSGNVLYYQDYTLDEALSPTLEHISELSSPTIGWYNCYSFGNGVESHRIRDDYNAVTLDKGPRVSTTLEETYKEEVLGNGMIFSGIYNSTSSVNQLNQFIMAENITKELNPEYGTIQKLFTRNTNIVAFCENKILKVLANKDALFNADGSMQVTATNKVLGQAIPFVGEYGISRNPESFANFGYRVYFADRDRGSVLRLSADGLTPISDKDMVSYFKYTLPNSNNIIGSYDEDRDTYNLTLDEKTVSFSEKVNGWTSFKSFLSESGLSVNGEYYTFKSGDLWKHHTKAVRNNFYNTQYESSVKLVFNDMVDEIKNFHTLNYEGTTSRIYEDNVGEENQLLTKGWYTSSVRTDLEEAKVVYFKDKEGKWFNNITGVSKTAEDINLKDFTSQGLGLLETVIAGSHPNYKTIYIDAVLPSSSPVVDAVGTGSGIRNNLGLIINTPVMTYAEDAGYDANTKILINNYNTISFESHSSSSITTEPEYFYVTGVVTNLVPGDSYYIEADVEISQNHSNLAVQFGLENCSDYKNTYSTNTSGKIYASFVYNPTGNDGVGIHIAKGHSIDGVVRNISCVNITPKSDESTYTVNTSLTDRTNTTVRLTENIVVGSSTVVSKTLYIHANTVNGIKHAVAASSFVATSSNSAVEVGTLTDSSETGYYENVIKVPLTITYTNGDPFPDKDVEAYVNIQGSTTLAVYQ